MNYTTLWARSVKGKNLGLVMNDGSFHSKQKNFQAGELVRYLKAKKGS